jgi:hypothetical protein
MKTKGFLITVVCLLFACQTVVFGRDSQTFKERTENWLKANSGTSGNGLIGGETPGGDPTVGNGLIGDETPTDDSTVGSPIGDALWIALGCSLIYGFCIFKGKRKGREIL